MSSKANDIAVIGMSCRFPGVDNLSEFWRLLLAGESTVGRFPKDRETGSNLFANPDADTLTSGSFFAEIDQFDAEFFGTGPAEAAAMDPVQRLGLELAWEAVEDAGIPAAALAGREIDVLVGAGASGYDALRRRTGSDRDDHYAALGSGGALIANRISSLFDVRGMSLCTDSGQSSSLVSLALACDRIRAGAVDLALVGGVHLVVDPEDGVALVNLGALSPDARCYPFDARANGFVRGEGGAFVLLKQFDQAVADGDHIYTVIRGWGITSGGATVKIPDPSPTGQTATILSALERADVPFDSIDYLETHGTGTRLGDPAEIAGVRGVLEGGSRTRPLVIGSVKANVGHLEPAAGITGFVKTALCVDRGLLVPNVNFRTPNPAIPDFDADFEVLQAPRPWTGVPRRAGVSSFGMGGTVAHVILEQVQAKAAEAPVEVSGVLPWVLSGRSEQAVRDQAARLAELLAEDAALSASEVGYSLLANRSLLGHRAVVLGADRGELQAGVEALAAEGDSVRVVRGVTTGPASPVVFVFPGQGSQWVAMGRQLYVESEVFAARIRECAQALEKWTDWSVLDVVTGAPDAADLARIEVVQPALFAVMVALAEVWRSLGVVPDAVVGASQGEIAAACVAGALSLEDAAKIVAVRSRLLARIVGQGGLAGVLLPADRVRELLPRWENKLAISGINGPNSTTVAGETQALEELIAACVADGVRAKWIPASVAGHSPLVDQFEDELRDELGPIVPRPTSVAFYSTVTAGRLDAAALDTAYWFRNMRETVQFEPTMRLVLDQVPGAVVEVSPHPLLVMSIQELAETATPAPGRVAVGSLRRDEGGLAQLYRSVAEVFVAGTEVSWGDLFPGREGRGVGLPTYAFQRRRYWLTATEETAELPGEATPLADLSSESAVLDLVCAETAAVLRHKESMTAIDLLARSAESFKDLGFDSSMAVTLRNRL
ncbi:MAG TPA: acyltransferase domain-containing protein, partial [Pseudonocardiaceae bacterium]|nr:acyltransferase domain-containing protein [Pseudonocardiaceae bacterium]